MCVWKGEKFLLYWKILHICIINVPLLIEKVFKKYRLRIIDEKQLVPI